MPQQPWSTPVLLDPWRAFFPYQRFFQGDYLSNAPIVYDRRAGFRPREDQITYKLPFNTYQPSYTSLYNDDCIRQPHRQPWYKDIHSKGNLCFATSPGTFYPCENCEDKCNHQGQCFHSPHLLHQRAIIQDR